MVLRLPAGTWYVRVTLLPLARRYSIDAVVSLAPGFCSRKNVWSPAIVAPSAKYHVVAGALTPVLA